MRKKLLIFLSFIILIVAAGIYICNKVIINASNDKLYSQVNSVPFNKVGLLLGTSKYVLGNRSNPFYTYRIEAAVKLIKAGKIKYLIISGDNGRKDMPFP